VAGFYASLLVAVWLSAERSRRLAAATILGAWCAIGCFAMGRTPTDHTLRATFLSVGHGLAVVLELPDGKTMVYDAGCLASPEHATQAVSCFLWSRRINRLDTVMISHADVDHYNGLTELLERFKIERICVSPAMLATERDEALTLLFDSLSSAGIPMVTIAGNMDLAERNNTSPPYSLRLLHPPLEGTGGSDNSNSLVLLVEFHGRRVLLTGDLESPGLERLLRQPPVDCDGLLAPHHGSARSDPPGLAAWSSPEFVVFSGGGSRDSRSAQRAYFDHGARTLHTAETGAVTVVMNDKGVAVTPFREVSDRDRIERATGE
jgi:competence protein ComEC